MPRKYNYTKKTGRPQTQLKDAFPPNWQGLILKMASQGCSDVEIRAAIIKYNGLSFTAVRALWYELKKREAEFSETLLLARILCEAWWQEKGRKKLSARYFRDHTWLANMKNRFGWRERAEIEHGLTDNLIDKFKDLSIEQLKGRLNDLLGNKKT